jgi:phage FluMu gp28-like protein
MELYPCQKRWIEDKNRLKIGVRSRRIGYSFADGFENVLDCIEHPRKNHIILSRGERQAKEFITETVAPRVRAIVGGRPKKRQSVTATKQRACELP